MTKVTGSIFNSIEDDEGMAEVLNIKAALFDAINIHNDIWSLTQQQAAKLMGVPRSRISCIKRGKVEGFTIDYLIAMCARADIDHIMLNYLRD